MARSLLAFCLVAALWIATASATPPAGPGSAVEPDALGCTVVLPRGPLPAGHGVQLRATVTNPEPTRVLYRWHLGGAIDRILSGESFGNQTITTSVVFERDGQAFPISLTLTDSEGRRSTCRASVTIGEPRANGPGATVAEADPPRDPADQSHTVLAFNDIGMHCMDLDSLPFSIRPPISVVHAQVVERGDPPRLADETEVSLSYSAASSDTDPVLPPPVVDLDGLPPLEGSQSFAARELLTAANLEVAAGADVLFSSGGEVRIAPGFSVAQGALFEIAIEPSLDAPSINSTSQNQPPGASADDALIRKGDLWDEIDSLGATVVATLFGVDPPPDEGLPTIHNPTGGRSMPGIADPYLDNDPQPFSAYDAVDQRFLAEGIPLTPIDDLGRLNPYPLLRIQASDSATEELLAAIDAVAPVSTGIDCRDCHRRGDVAADPAARAVEIPFVDPSIPGDPISEERAAKQNILLLHDFKWGTHHADGPTVLCASCHESLTLESLFPVLDPGEPPHLTLSNVMHSQHGRFVVDIASDELVRTPEGEPVLRTVPEPGERFLLESDPLDPSIGMEQNCFRCHPGNSSAYFRGVMADPGGLKCSSCHGAMLAVGALFEGDFDHTGSPRVREPWLDEPRCESCHLGDAVDPGGPDLPARLAFDPADPAAVPILSTNDRFAENRGDTGALVLYRDSHGHGGIACESCHGSPHAIWPHPEQAANDNVTALQLQGALGPLTDCVVCHRSRSFPSGTLDGPHGLHSVADPDWIRSSGSWHRGYAEEPGDACAPCHGVDHLGTRLSRAFADRELRRADGTLEAVVSAGDVIWCGLCHSIDESF